MTKINSAKYDLEATDSDWKRFWSKVEQTETCWLWSGKKSPNGYGTFTKYGHNLSAHRWIFHKMVERVLPNKVVDHICRTRECVRPSHLRAITNRENVLIGSGVSARNSRKTHCHKGHEFTQENTILVKTHAKNQTRKCKTCELEIRKRRRAKEAAMRQPKAYKSHCHRGHPFDEENTYVSKIGRHCRACARFLYNEKLKAGKE